MAETEAKNLWDSYNGKGFAAEYSEYADRAGNDAAGNQIDATYATKTEVSAKADVATTLAGYGITDAYTKTESDALYATSSTVEQHVNATDNPHQVTKEQVGLGNVGNFKAVSTGAWQGLDSTEKANARANIDAMENVVASADSVFMNLNGVNMWVRASKGTYEVPMESTVTIGGRKYQIVKIGNQMWMAENLDYKFTGLNIGTSGTPSVATAWYYNNDESTYGISGNKYGLLYNGYAANYLNNNAATLLPDADGWHVPTRNDINALLVSVCGTSAMMNTAGVKLKSTSGWINDGNGTDDFGMGILPTGGYENAAFGGIGDVGSIWSSTALNSSNNYFMVCYSDANQAMVSTTSIDRAYSVRLVKNLE